MSDDSNKPPAIPGYTVKSYCGKGAYGEVWLAEDSDGVLRAVKLLLKSSAPEALARERKALNLYRTRVPEHPNLIRVFHTGEADTHIYYAMEPADNDDDGSPTYSPRTLDSEIRGRGRLPAAEVAAVAERLLDAVSCLHAAGLVYRDIKPTKYRLRPWGAEAGRHRTSHT